MICPMKVIELRQPLTARLPASAGCPAERLDAMADRAAKRFILFWRRFFVSAYPHWRWAKKIGSLSYFTMKCIPDLPVRT